MFHLLFWASVIIALGWHVVSSYHHERSLRLLIEALLIEDPEVTNIPWPVDQPLTVSRAKALTGEARNGFRTALSRQKTNAQACHWLGRTALLLDRPEEAIQDFSVCARSQLLDPLGWWNLGLAYERLAQRVEGKIGWAFQSGWVPDGTMVPLQSSPLMSVTLGASEIKTPAILIDTPYCSQGTPPRSCYVALTVWEMPLAVEVQPQDWWVPEEPVLRSVLFMHSPSQVVFSVTLPVTPTTLVFWMGMDPAMWNFAGDGVEYRVRVDDEAIFEHTLTPEAAQRGWWPGQVHLGAWAGRTARLTLETNAGLTGDSQGDWAGWGDMRLVESGAVEDVLSDPILRAGAAWREGGVAAHQLIDVGKGAWRGKQYEASLNWYRRAAWVEPTLGDPWFFMGLVYEEMGEWDSALSVYRKMTEAEAGTIGASSGYYRMGVIYQRNLESRNVKRALIMFERAIEKNTFRSTWEAADSHYRRGIILRQQGAGPEMYIAELEQAVMIHPEHQMAHVLLGTTYYALFGDMAMAEEEIGKALELNPQNKWAYLHLGDVYRQAGLCEKAQETYREALEVDHEFNAATTRLEMTCEHK